MNTPNYKQFCDLTPEQLEDRRNGIGGSECAAVMGESRYATPLDVYNHKVGLGEDFEGSLLTAFGSFSEPFIKKMYSEMKGKKFIKPSKTIAHRKYPWMRANLDFISRDREIAGEFKLSFKGDDWQEEGTDNFVTEYLYQCANNRLVAASYYGIDYELFTCAALVKPAYKQLAIKEYFYRKNKILEEEIIDRTHDLWHNHVLPQIPPPFSSVKEVAKYCTDIKDEAIVADDVIIELLESHDGLKEKIKELGKQEERIKTQLASTLKDKMYIINSEGKNIFSWKPQISKRLDTKKVKELHPSVYAEALVESQSRVMRRHNG